MRDGRGRADRPAGVCSLVANCQFDGFVACYVLDLLPDRTARTVLAEACCMRPTG